MSDIKWTPAQRAAIDINADRILVSAAAGSGKSTVLTERIISAITREKNPHDLQRLMVVTFTRASAEDLKNKISSAVKKAVAEQPSNKCLNDQLIKLPSAKINTIHGLCYSLIKSRFDLLNLPAAISVADETVVISLRLEIMEKLLNRCFNGMFEPIKDFASFCEFFIASENNIVTGGSCLHRAELLPERINFLVFREEAVTADVHSVSFIFRCAGDTADEAFFLENDGFYVGFLK